MTTILAATNADWGFFGTISRVEESGPVDAGEAWALAFAAVAKATGAEAEAVRAFLDSRYGRHFADDVANALYDKMPLAQAVDAAARRWMGWRIPREMARSTGIPAGLPYLTGFVMHCGIMAEANEGQAA